MERGVVPLDCGDEAFGDGSFLVGGRGNAAAAGAGSGTSIVPPSRGSCNTMTGTARQRGTQDAEKIPGHRWLGLLRTTLSQQTDRNQRPS